jgi:subfamily B ATP-binding cassette protein HlyB/CyaB
MDQTAPVSSSSTRVDAGLRALCGIAAYYRIGADPAQLARELALHERMADESDLPRGARILGLRARFVTGVGATRLAGLPTPAIVRVKSGAFLVFAGRTPTGLCRLVDPVSQGATEISVEELSTETAGNALLVARQVGGAGISPSSFGIRWFLPTLWRYRRPLGHVLAASLFVQIFALTTPLFFQVIVDKVLAHRGYETLFVLIAGLATIGLFDVVLQYLRTYALAHTTNRIDVELGQRLFAHLLRLPMSYFETRSAGQTVARVRELETIRSFLTGQGLFSAIDLFFTFVFIAVLFAYSWSLTLIALAAVPFYVLIGFSVRPPLRALVNEKFNRGAASQQFLVETIVGANAVKAAAVEPVMRSQWEEKLAAYVKTSFAATMLGSGGQLAIQCISKLSTAGLLLFGARAVMDGELSVGALVAFNMIASQAVQPILRLSQIWQDFQQVQISIERLGDILNTAPEPAPTTRLALPTPRGAIEFRNVSFRYRNCGPEVLKNVSLSIQPGETIGVVGPSGSGKSTLTKLVQRLYLPGEGQVFLDGADLSQVDPAWLRSHIGVVLQENVLFNRTIHENIAFAYPAMSRARVIEIARLAGADEFIEKLSEGYDTMVEERGANLSGGQRQRIAIARALATDPRILILDEATSALDYESERIIQRNMRRIVSGRTVIIIAHRLADGARLRPHHRHDGRAHRRSRRAQRTRPASRRSLCLSLGAPERTGGVRLMTEAARAVARIEPAPPEQAMTRILAKMTAPGPNRSDREFLGPALEILETPASPVKVAFLWAICALVAVSLAWAYFGRIDIIASAQGKFQPTGRVKVIEPVETGRVAAIHVANDTPVKAGDVLVELDRSAAEADVAAAKAELASANAEALRHRAALAAVKTRALSPGKQVDWPDELASDLRQREEQVLAADLGQLAATLASFDAQRAQKTAERDKLSHTIETQKNLIATLQERVDMRSKLVEAKAGAKAAVIDATETLQYQQTQLAVQEGQLASLTTGLEVIARDAEKAVQTFLSNNAQKLIDAERRVEDAKQHRAKADAEVDHLTLRSPIAGRVQSSIIASVGQVVTSGQEIMRILPQDSKLEIEAYVFNRDIGFVSVGQEAVVKVESFPFTRYGSIRARVLRIARDAIPAPDASAIEGDPARGSNATGFAGGERTQNLVFAVVLEPKASTISIDGVDLPLTSGMAVAVEFKTGARRLLEYLFSPLVEVASRAMRER